MRILSQVLYCHYYSGTPVEEALLIKIPNETLIELQPDGAFFKETRLSHSQLKVSQIQTFLVVVNDVGSDGGGNDDAPFTASTLLEALEVLVARKSVLVSRARGERRPPSRVEAAWLETLRAEVALLESE